MSKNEQLQNISQGGYLSKRCGLIMNNNLQTGRYSVGEELFQIDGRNDQVKVLPNVSNIFGPYTHCTDTVDQLYGFSKKCILQFGTIYFGD